MVADRSETWYEIREGEPSGVDIARRDQEISVDRLREIVIQDEIEQLKHRYLRLVDTKQWDELGSLFTTDATTSYGDGEHTYRGRDAIVEFLRRSLGVPGCISVHTACQPEFEEITEERVRARWALRDRVIYLKYDLQIEGAAYYVDEFVRHGDAWLIAHTGYERQYEQRFSRGSLKGLTMTSNRFPLEVPE